MSNDFLSQDEIDALLNGGGIPPVPAGGAEPANAADTTAGHKDAINPDDYLSSFARDAIGEVGNITFGTAATTLSMLLRQKVNITTPVVGLIRNEEVKDTMSVPQVVAKVEYTEGLTGSNVLAISANDAQIIADLMLGGDGTSPTQELNELHLSAVAEAMNQMMGSAATSMSTMFNMTVNISPPIVRVTDFGADDASLFVPSPEVLVEVSFHLQVGELIDSHIMQMFPIEFAHKIVDLLMGGSGSDEAAVQAAATAAPALETPSAAPVSQPRPSAGHSAAAPAGVPAHGMSAQPAKSAQHMMPPPVVERAVFTAFDDTPATHAGRNLDLLLDIPLGVTVELGRTKRMIKDILDMAPGAIIELDKLAGEPVDILVNNKLIARGEVVVIEENFGVRITDILSPTERIKKLQ